jgi:hypothetical protein
MFFGVARAGHSEERRRRGAGIRRVVVVTLVFVTLALGRLALVRGKGRSQES